MKGNSSNSLRQELGVFHVSHKLQYKRKALSYSY